MTIPNYIRPQQRIFQLLDITPTATAGRINALVVGPAYFVQRYGQEERQASTFASAGQDLLYTFVDEMGGVSELEDTDYTLDTASVRVFAEDVEALLSTFDDTDLTLDAGRTKLISSVDDFLGASLRSELDNRPVQVGDVVDVEVTGGSVFRRTVASFEGDNTIILNMAVPGAGLVGFKTIYIHSGELEASLLTVAGAKVSTDAFIGLTIVGKDSAAALQDGVGNLFVQFRALMKPPADESYISIRSAQDIIDNLGTIALDNDLAYAASRALSGSGGKRIYALRVATDDVSGFSAALNKISSTDYTYALAPITTDTGVMDIVATHVGSMSQPDVKNFRRAYLGYDSPGEYPVLETVAFTAATFNSNANRYVTVTNGGLISAGVKSGYIFRAGGADYEVQERISDTELILTGVGAAAGNADLLSPDTARGQADAVISRAGAFDSRRVAHVWSHKGTSFVEGSYQVIPNRFAASEAAGIRSALQPQQGLTRTEITTFTDVASMHTLFTNDLLDEIAAAGTFIITQDVESGSVYIRHQLTTDTSNESLYYEDSVGTNLDDLSFKIKDALEGFIGKYNLTPQTIAQARGAVRDILQEATESDAGAQVGAQIISYADLVVQADPVLKDRLQISVTVEIPLPLNNIDTYIRASIGLTI